MMDRKTYFLRERSFGMARAVAIIVLSGARPLREGFGDNADVVDAGHAQSIDDGSKNSERNRLIAAQEHTLAGIFQLGVNLCAKLMDIDGVVAELNAFSTWAVTSMAKLSKRWARSRIFCKN